METQPIKKGVVFKTSKLGVLLLCIHRETALNYLSTQPTDEHGWIHFEVIKKTNPLNNITHLTSTIKDFTFIPTLNDAIVSKGICFYEGPYGSMNVSFKLSLLKDYIMSLDTTPEGWVKFNVRDVKNGVRGIYKFGFEYVVERRETKPYNDFETK